MERAANRGMAARERGVQFMLLPVTGRSGGKRKNTVVKTVNTRPTTLAMGPRIGPTVVRAVSGSSSFRLRSNVLVMVGSGNDAGRSKWRPRARRRAIGIEYDTLRKTTEDERIALSAEDEPR